METHELRTRGRSLARLISAFAYFCRPSFNWRRLKRTGRQVATGALVT
jgi:hypothetical protein